MKTTSDALKELIATVEADVDFVGAPLNLAVDALSADCGTTDYEFAVWFRDSARGDLNAAKALHDSLLPGWGYAVSPQYAIVRHPKNHTRDKDAFSLDNPARSWLLAILKAKMAEVGE